MFVAYNVFEANVAALGGRHVCPATPRRRVPVGSKGE